MHEAARNFQSASEPEGDSKGHGTHTSSIVAGREVVGASYFGLAEGTATGGVPGARIVVYKVCWSSRYSSVDILAGFDDAIADEVDVISMSIGSRFPRQYFEDLIAIGSFHAMRKGILTSASARNSRPFPSTVNNFAPWIQNVAGLSINSFDLNGKSFPLIWGGGVVNYYAGADTTISKFCFPSALNSHKVKEKIVLCEITHDGHDILIANATILIANGVGTIMVYSSIKDFAFSYFLPATVINTKDGLKVLDYIKSIENPIATILVGKTWKDVMAPYVVSFSSRGPNPITPDILKLDLTAPGVDILAAWSPIAPPTIDSEDNRSVCYTSGLSKWFNNVKFNIISSTSMSCPNASGATAYVKAIHPNWSLATIKSALMTTDLEYAYGFGHINPLKAVDPGLVCERFVADYINFLCKQDNSSFCNTTPRAWDLNYPSFSLAVEDVTNVGSPNSTYIQHPHVLSFSAIGEKKSFTMKVYGQNIAQQSIILGAVTWSDGVHALRIRSPLVVYSETTIR
ncbi:hypothetical protein I3842_11G140700 [Carya illinoinensis]|uniref:Cucumisin n=1 Tax=Carya illinoinensis TaxID=32201 RepID=A0A922IZK5_CARIL|nr:hypothetical protein I3842_11G140700 [Carya illinoinensis]